MPPHAFKTHASDVASINPNHPLLHIVKACQQVDERGFPSTRWPDNRDDFPRLNTKVDIVQHGIFGVIAESDMIKFDFSGHGWQQNSIRGIDDLRLRIEGFKDAVDSGGCPLQLDIEVDDACCGVIEVAEVRVEREELARLDFTPDHFAPVPKDSARPDGADQAADNLKVAVQVALVHRDDEAFCLSFPKALDFPRFHRECFHDRDAIDFLGETTDHRFPLLAKRDADFADVFEEELVAQHIDGEDADGSDSEAPLDCEQPGGHDKEGCDIGDQQDKPGC